MKLPRQLEHEVQAEIVKVLQMCGLTVYETTAYRQKGKSGVDKGIPDLLVCVQPNLFLGIEVKRPGESVKYSSLEQEQAHASGHFFIVQSVDQALVCCCSTIDLGAKAVIVERVMRSLGLTDKTFLDTFKDLRALNPHIFKENR